MSQSFSSHHSSFPFFNITLIHLSRLIKRVKEISEEEYLANVVGVGSTVDASGLPSGTNEVESVADIVEIDGEDVTASGLESASSRAKSVTKADEESFAIIESDNSVTGEERMEDDKILGCRELEEFQFDSIDTAARWWLY